MNFCSPLNKGLILIISSFLILSLTSISCKKEVLFPSTENQDELNQAIINAMERDAIPSLVTCIVKNDQIVWQNAFGYHDLEKQLSPNSETVYLLASISKTITAVAIMQLYEQGRLDLNADINNYLPFAVRNPYFPGDPITTEMLLTHTSGLAWPTNEEDPRFNDRMAEEVTPALEEWLKDYILPEGDKFLPVVWKNTRPGKKFQYTNIGGALLGFIVESISGKDFNQYCQEYIFDPLEMFNSGFRTTDVDESKLATIYHDGQVISQYNVPHYPASMARSSLEELSHFLIAIMNGGEYKSSRILEERTVDEMLSIKIKEVAFIWTRENKHWIGHTGGYWGVSSLLDFYPEKNVGVILITNTYGRESLYPGGRIYDLVHGEAQKYFD